MTMMQERYENGVVMMRYENDEGINIWVIWELHGNENWAAVGIVCELQGHWSDMMKGVGTVGEWFQSSAEIHREVIGLA